MDRKTKFLQVYANLPFSLRNEIIVVLNDETFTWNSARIEVENDTSKGKEILGKLERFGIIK